MGPAQAEVAADIRLSSSLHGSGFTKCLHQVLIVTHLRALRDRQSDGGAGGARLYLPWHWPDHQLLRCGGGGGWAKVGCGSKQMASHFGVYRCTTYFGTYFSGDWDVHWGYGILTHGKSCLTDNQTLPHTGGGGGGNGPKMVSRRQLHSAQLVPKKAKGGRRDYCLCRISPAEGFGTFVLHFWTEGNGSLFKKGNPPKRVGGLVVYPQAEPLSSIQPIKSRDRLLGRWATSACCPWAWRWRASSEKSGPRPCLQPGKDDFQWGCGGKWEFMGAKQEGGGGSSNKALRLT